MKFDYVSIEKRDGIAIIRFDRKANLNAFNEKLVVELTPPRHDPRCKGDHRPVRPDVGFIPAEFFF